MILWISKMVFIFSFFIFHELFVNIKLSVFLLLFKSCTKFKNNIVIINNLIICWKINFWICFVFLIFFYSDSDNEFIIYEIKIILSFMLIEMMIKFHLAIYMELLETVYLLIKKLKVRILKWNLKIIRIYF